MSPQPSRDSAPPAEDPNELKPNTGAAADSQTQAADPNELKPNVPADQPASAPPQMNELQPGQGGTTEAASKSADGQQPADDKDLASSSKHKKKKGLLHKVIPGG
jgi:hypothetical protein